MSRPTKASLRIQELEVENWNFKYDIGTPVTVTLDSGEVRSEYRAFWDSVTVALLPRDPATVVRIADELTSLRADRFGSTGYLHCTCGNHLVCDKCHCSPSTCNCTKETT